MTLLAAGDDLDGMLRLLWLAGAVAITPGAIAFLSLAVHLAFWPTPQARHVAAPPG